MAEPATALPPSSEASAVQPEPDMAATEPIADMEEKTAQSASSRASHSSGKGKMALTRSPSEDLPKEILETILYQVDTETFASLILASSAWRKAADSSQLYAYHISRCHLGSKEGDKTMDSLKGTDLQQLKRAFAQEVKQNLFPAYLQPSKATINLVSTTISSAAAMPGGESFDFSFSPDGLRILAWSTSRLYLLRIEGSQVSVDRQFKVHRRPIAASLIEDGTKMAVLSSPHRVNIYGLTSPKVNRVKCVLLDNASHAIALTNKGEVIAAAYDQGIELQSLLSTEVEMQKRVVKSSRADTLSFSSDGLMLLGTTFRPASEPNTIILTAPYYSDEIQELPPDEQIAHIWTSQIIFPNSSRDCSHAKLLQNRNDGDATWAFTFDRVFESFRAVRTDDLRNGTTYFTGPQLPDTDHEYFRHGLDPSTLPAPSQSGQLVAAGFFGREIWLYGVPTTLEVPPGNRHDESFSGISNPGTPNSASRTPGISATGEEGIQHTRLPNWQTLVDKYRNSFARGIRVAEVPGVKALQWIDLSSMATDEHSRERLIIAAPSGLAMDPELEQEEFVSSDGGKLVILDFERRIASAEDTEITIELGDAEPETLPEAEVDLATEVELVRQRTQRGQRPFSTVIDVLAPAERPPDVPPLPTTVNPVQENLNTTEDNAEPDVPVSPEAGKERSSDAPLLDTVPVETFEDPYSHTQPRSRNTLYRSATAVAANRHRNAPSIMASSRIEYRRPRNPRELPHESDADNWVPPPPPYKPKADTPLPDHLKQTLLPKDSNNSARRPSDRERPRRAATMYASSNTDARNMRARRQHSAHHSSQSQTLMDARSVSESLDRLSPPVSPMSLSDAPVGNETSGSTRQPEQRRSATLRRPVSEYVGRWTASMVRPSSAGAGSAQSKGNFSSNGIKASNKSLESLPVSPVPADVAASHRTSSSHGHEAAVFADLPAIPALPTPQQLENLNNRFRQPPSPQSIRRKPTPINTSGGRIPAPPPGALGAAGNSNSTSSTGNLLRAPSRNLSERIRADRRSSQASTSSFLDPDLQRLDTIESVSSSLVSRSMSRSSRTHPVGSRRGSERTQSIGPGPALKLDRMQVLSSSSGSEGWGLKSSWRKGRQARRRKGDGEQTDTPAPAAPAVAAAAAGASPRQAGKGKVTKENPGVSDKGGRCMVM